jgi:protoporphyrinogen/coproporphyrinogen III oxidase
VRRAIVIGGGPSGLVLARALADGGGGPAGAGLDVTLYEARERPGGKAWTERERGYTIERGPEGFLDSAPATLALARSLGLGERLLPARGAAAKRYLWARGALRPVPTNPAAFLASGILTLRGRLAVLGEPFRRPGPGGDESVAAFAGRRLGREAAETLVGAMVRGVYAGDAHEISMPSAFPRLAALEREHGSLVRAMIARRKSRAGGGGPAGPAGRITSFVGGMAELGAALAASLGPRFVPGRPAAAVRRAGGGWRVEFADGGSEFCDRLALAVEPWSAARLLEGVDRALAEALALIPPAPAVVVALGFASENVRRPLDGFGFLVPPREPLRMLGCLWSSTTFAHRAPEGRVLLRVLLGGPSDPTAVELADDRLLALVLNELDRTVGLTGAPELARVIRWPQAIPQYTVGHGERLRRIAERLQRLPGLHLAGNGYRGVALNDCVTSAQAVARAMLADPDANADVPAPASNAAVA